MQSEISCGKKQTHRQKTNATENRTHGLRSSWSIVVDCDGKYNEIRRVREINQTVTTLETLHCRVDDGARSRSSRAVVDSDGANRAPVHDVGLMPPNVYETRRCCHTPVSIISSHWVHSSIKPMCGAMRRHNVTAPVWSRERDVKPWP